VESEEMSHVTNVIVAFMITSDTKAQKVIDRINKLIPYNEDRHQALLYLNPTESYGGSKCLEVELAIGAFNYLNLDEWLKALQVEDWTELDPGFIQVLIQDQNDNGFGSITVYDDGSFEPWLGLRYFRSGIEE
jgi:hypothetical protein